MIPFVSEVYRVSKTILFYRFPGINICDSEIFHVSKDTL
ncbi:hypothetical protein A464_2323 [Salmonella bongori N268-08]|uniref:Uncharacterized protein n=1 Tax=Salmonella bongori N268-08 TaxID=1197719 RepID=S5MXT7_SALBN|nr:hypothetical protein A464_2323 [Salmonella bongori N268-08]